MAETMNALDLLARDHREVEDLFTQYEATTDTERKTEIAHQVVHDLAVHGEIEELRFYPRLREVLDNGDALADEAIEEHLAIKNTLNDLDSMTAEDDGFDDRMRELMAEVRHHVQEEEGELFTGLRQALDEEELQTLGEKLERARSMVPTRPHPGAPTSPGAKAAASPPVALIDRIRDAIRNAGD
ncbi:hemerythrin domain-containing protein [Egicoccus sp. AB-alg2]|uniref:hemerythrin domain-containing protein n=1 Tax=Egicoccus sp. AB-alg2 TaxID=3242693 RepID=UPI00359EF646